MPLLNVYMNRSDVDDRQHSRKMSRREFDESTAISIVPNKDAEIAGSVIGKLTTVEALETGKVSAASFAQELFFFREQRMVGEGDPLIL